MTKQINVSKELQDLDGMSVKQPQAKYAEVFGVPTNSHNKPYLKKRCAWQIQANSVGELTERAKKHAAELAKKQELRVRQPGKRKAAAAAKEHTIERRFVGAHDPRIPVPGTVLTREFKG